MKLSRLHFHIKIFFMNHWGKIVIALSLIALIFLAVWGMMSLESFHRQITLATMPIHLLMAILNACIFVFLYMKVLRNGFSSMKTSKAKSSQVNVRFDQVIGVDEAKHEAREVVELLKDRTKLKMIGGNIIRGIIMMGPPGCGKTLLAKAIATEAGLPFLPISGSEFVEVFVGVGASRVRQLFKHARRLAYEHGGCMIFIDELDAIGRKRQMGSFGGGQETDSTLNQLLVEIDGLDSRASNVVIIGATNANKNVLDTALMRPGRFDRKVIVGKPGLKGREKVLKFYLDKVRHDPLIDVSKLARRTVHKSPADIENVVKEGALIATRDNEEQVSYRHLTQALERIDMGLKVKTDMSDREKKETAYHEAGHLIVLYRLHPTDDVFKASIGKRDQTLGVVYHLPKEDYHSYNKDMLLANIKTALGGYVAERIYMGGNSTTGVSGDFKNAMQIAHAMVWDCGMGETGHVGAYSLIPEHQLSEQIKYELNQETNRIIQTCLKEVENLLTEQRALLDKFADELFKREELEYDDIENIFKEYDGIGQISEGIVASDIQNTIQLNPNDSNF